jgi:cell division protein ZipA
MSELRIVLLVLGVVAVAGLYFWEAGRDRRQQRRRTVTSAPGGESIPVRTREPVSESEQGQSAAAPGGDHIIALHVVSTGAPFEGPDIVAAAEGAALQYGPMRIFHRFDAGGVEYEKPLFSVASIREPGHIDRDAIEDFRTPGLSLFMCQPSPAGDHLVFDLMLRTAEQFASSLGGEVCGPDHARLDQGRLATLRARLSA